MHAGLPRLDVGLDVLCRIRHGSGPLPALFLDYGLTFDEELSRTYAEGILRWFQTLGTDRHDALEFRNLYFYGGFFEVLAQSVGRNFPAGVFEGRHLVNVLFGLLGVWGTRRLGTVVGGARAGFWAGLFLLVNPVYYGHSFNNPKDIPFAALSAWALVAMFEATRAIPKVRWTQVVGTGVATGLMLGVRPGGVFFFGYMVILWSSGLLMALRQTGARWKECRGDVGRLLLNVAAVAAVSWIVMLAFWPFGQIAPLSNPLRAMRETTNFGWAGPVLLNGNFELSTDLPWTYLPTYFAISLPEFYYLGLLCGVSAAAVAILRRRLSGRSALFSACSSS